MWSHDSHTHNTVVYSFLWSSLLKTGHSAFITMQYIKYKKYSFLFHDLVKKKCYNCESSIIINSNLRVSFICIYFNIIRCKSFVFESTIKNNWSHAFRLLVSLNNDSSCHYCQLYNEINQINSLDKLILNAKISNLKLREWRTNYFTW